MMADIPQPIIKRWLSLAMPMLGQPLFQLQVLLVLSLLLGGGGVAYGVRNLIIQLFALGLLAVNASLVRQFLSQTPRALIVLVGLTLALPLVQLVPLPSGVWQAMPGRDPIIQAFSIADIPASIWQPWSVDKARTLVAFCGLIAPVTIIVLATNLSSKDLRALAWTLVSLAVFAFLCGVLQLTSANTIGQFYPIRAKPDVLYGLFANRNSMGLYFVIGLTFAIALPPWKFQGAKLAKVVLFTFLLLGALLTQSRSSMALLAVPIVFGVAKLVWGLINKRRVAPFRLRKAQLPALLLSGVLVGAMGVSLATGGRVADSIERLVNTDTDRAEVWDDTLYAAKHYWPVGTGMGTFDEAFQLHESLEYVSLRRAGRAHNDYLELGMEAGIAGLAILLGWVAWLALAAWRWKTRPAPWLALSASAGLTCIALQSLLDYPLRNQAILCLAALMVAMLARTAQREKVEEKQ